MENIKKKGVLTSVATTTSIAILLGNLALNQVAHAEESNEKLTKQTAFQKFIIDKNNKTVDKIKVVKGDKVSFLIKTKLANNQPITKVKISDDIENVLDINKDIKVYVPKNEDTIKDSLDFKNNFNDITNQGRLKVNEEEESFDWVANNPNDLRGKTIYVLVNVKTKKSGDYHNYLSEKGIVISNSAKQQINSNEAISNKVDVVIKPTSDKNLEIIQNALASQHISLDLLNKDNKRASNINQIQQTSTKAEDIQDSNNKITNSHNKLTFNIESEEKKEELNAKDANNNEDKMKNKQDTPDKSDKKDSKKETETNYKDKEKQESDVKNNIFKDDKVKSKDTKDDSKKEKVLPNTGTKDNIIFTMLGLLVTFIGSITLVKGIKSKKLGEKSN
ncbi:LPXTG cell wall anchor domain-containing protein [Staphylococcus epidermidis]|nr:LPXTG cell wall anchor domain-containing protein [Staphylococcus epidermidis]MCG1591657.1 LPXTG cell wall anchor domain-containing protein [Staphylococcus epidermidis]MCG2478648.1 LPXTG cell wall anchor domain-containing protein [Staphylococcus epidermidis]